MAENEFPILELMLDYDQVNRRFASVDEVERWLEKEKKFWSWLQEAAKSSALEGTTSAVLSEIASAVAKLNSAREDDYEGAHRHLQIQLNEWKTRGVRLTSADPRAQFAKSVADDDPTLAGLVLTGFITPDELPRNAIGFRAMCYVTMFERGIDSNSAASEKASLSEALRDWTKFIDASKEDHQNLTDAQHRNVKAQEDSLEGHAAEFKHLIQEFRGDIEAIKKTYDEQLALQAPVDYWEKEAVRHNQRSNKFTWLFVVSLVGVTLAIGAICYYFVVPELKKSTDTPPYWPLAVLVGSAGMLIWPVRIVSRLLLSSIHLATDAKERVTMLQTYLSLLRNDKGISTEDRQLILENLFRSASTGIVRDDSAPTGLAGLTSGAIAGK